ncbi:MAG: hypothetical protein Q9227_005774 [Pyrenula ochraceoflavens]
MSTINAVSALRNHYRLCLGAVVLTGSAYASYRQFNPSPKITLDAPSRPKTFNGGWFKTLTLHSVEEVNHNVKKFKFELPDKNAVSGLEPCYTPGYVEFLIKRYPNGKSSEYLHSLKPGATISARGPLPTYPWKPNQHSHVVLLAGGAGITPIYQLAQTILENPKDKTKVTLVFGNNNDQDVLLKDKFDEFARDRGDQFKAVYAVSHTSEGSGYYKGYITKELLQKTMPSSHEPGVKVLVCGPPGLEKSITGQSGWFGGSYGGILKELGFSKDQVHRF